MNFNFKIVATFDETTQRGFESNTDIEGLMKSLRAQLLVKEHENFTVTNFRRWQPRPDIDQLFEYAALVNGEFRWGLMYTPDWTRALFYLLSQMDRQLFPS